MLAYFYEKGRKLLKVDNLTWLQKDILKALYTELSLKVEHYEFKSEKICTKTETINFF